MDTLVPTIAASFCVLAIFAVCDESEIFASAIQSVKVAMVKDKPSWRLAYDKVMKKNVVTINPPASVIEPTTPTTVPSVL